MECTHYFKKAYVYIHFYNGNYDAYENVHELTFIDDLVKILLKMTMVFCLLIITIGILFQRYILL